MAIIRLSKTSAGLLTGDFSILAAAREGVKESYSPGGAPFSLGAVPLRETGNHRERSQLTTRAGLAPSERLFLALDKIGEGTLYMERGAPRETANSLRYPEVSCATLDLHCHPADNGS
jgi:hypothetical protein